MPQKRSRNTMHRLLAVAVVFAIMAGFVPASTAEAQLMAWAILPRDDEMPAGYTFAPDYSHVYGLGNGVTKSYVGPFGTAWGTAADLYTSPYLAAVGYDRLVGSLRGKGMDVTTYSQAIGDASLIATQQDGPNMRIMQACFLQGRWIGCTLQRFHNTRGDGMLQMELLTLMHSRAVDMP